MKLSNRHKFMLLVIVVSIIISAIVAFAAPGDSDDPLVTLSYITDTLMPDIEQQIDDKISEAVSSGSPSGSAGGTYSLVNIKANHTVIGGEGTEFILRMGSGTIVATENGGVADLTAGVDLPHGTAIPANHMLVAPKNDSRGLKLDRDAIVLIKGTYTVIPD